MSRLRPDVPRESNSFTHGPIRAAAAALMGGNSEVTTANFKLIFPTMLLLLFGTIGHLHKALLTNPMKHSVLHLLFEK